MIPFNKEDFLMEGESIDDLNRNGLVIIQSDKGFKFGMDAVLLSGYAKADKGEKVLDMCSGNGIIPLLLSAKTEADKIVGIELQEYPAEMALRSLRLNRFLGEKRARCDAPDLDRIKIVKGDVREADKIFAPNSFDVITCNPPYIKDEGGIKNPDSAKRIARHDVELTLDEMLAAAFRLLKDKGRIYIVHRTFRLTELINSMHIHGIEAKRLRM